jgi:hypothetical protein
MAERKSRHHGLTSDGHGPDEHGLGGLPSPEDPRDFALADHPGYAAAFATAFPSAWLEPNTPPICGSGALSAARPASRPSEAAARGAHRPGRPRTSPSGSWRQGTRRPIDSSGSRFPPTRRRPG